MGEKTKMQGTVSWLFHLVAISFRYEMKQFNLILRIVGIPFKLPFSKEEKQKKKKTKSNRKKLKKNSPKISKIEKDDFIDEDPGNKIEDNKNESVDNIKEESYQNNKTTKKSKKRKGIWLSLKEKIINLKYTVRKFCDKIRMLINTCQEYKDIWNDEKVKLAIHKIKEQFLYFLKHCKPKKFKMYLHFGLEDPALTGQVLGGISLFYPLFHKNISVIPNFEHSILEGSIFVKGRVQVFVLLKIFIRLYWNKNIKYALRRLDAVKEKK
ncbi:DUF2953 domain-containing protein [Anaerosacchariphilus polymeriproducens]|nr:DUF2953 domain-containing protein [Anaerosacchariphilus polymeriproducens]